MNETLRSVLITGGAGYVGSVLVPRLLKEGCHVKVLDLYIYGEDVFKEYRCLELEEIKGEIRDQSLLKEILMQ